MPMDDLFLLLGIGAFSCADEDQRSGEPGIIAGPLRGFVAAIITPADRSTRPRRRTCAPAGALSSRRNTLEYIAQAPLRSRCSRQAEGAQRRHASRATKLSHTTAPVRRV